MERLPLERFAAVRAMMCRPHLDLVGASIQAGNTACDVWVDAREPNAALLWDGAHCYHLLGRPSRDVVDAMAALLGGEIRAAATERGRTFFKVYSDGAHWDELLPELYAGVALRRLERLFQAFEAPRAAAKDRALPEGFVVREIDRRLLGQSHLANLDDLVEEIVSMWGSREAFLKAGLGRCALFGDEVAGWCTTEYHSSGRCGMGVETVEAYQRRGIATVLAAAVADDCARAGLRPHWDSWAGNIPSVRVAEKVGFCPVETYPVHVGSWVNQV